MLGFNKCADTELEEENTAEADRCTAGSYEKPLWSIRSLDQQALEYKYMY